MEALHERLGWFCEITGISICVCTASAQSMDIHHLTGRPAFSAEFAQKCALDFQLQKRDAQNPLVLMFEPGFFIGIAMLGEQHYMILGPLSPFALNRSEVQKGCQYIVSSEDMPLFCDVLFGNPHLGYRSFAQAVTLAAYLAGGAHIPLEQFILYNHALPHREIERSLDESMFEVRENESYHVSYAWETRLFNAVELGDHDKMKQIALSPMVGRAGCMSLNPLSQERYTFISAVTNASRAAVRGGLPQEAAYSLADIYCQQMDNLHNVQDIYMLMFQMLGDYTQRVKKFRTGKKYTPAIAKCCAFINDHLHEDITLAHLASCCGLSRTSISTHFKKETGMSLPDYIHSEKIKEGKFLLKNTQYSIAEISSILQYNSQSYFTKIFKEQVGCTPQQYKSRQSQ